MPNALGDGSPIRLCSSGLPEGLVPHGDERHDHDQEGSECLGSIAHSERWLRLPPSRAITKSNYRTSERASRFTERYWRNPGENDLQMELVIHDPVNYTQPVRFEREWIWTPDERVHPYNCFSLELDESEPVDIDELKRRLEQL